MVIKAFKQFFIPHEHNDYKPHFFRELSIVCITLVAVALFSISSLSTLYIKNSGMTAAVLPAVLVDLTNSARASNNTQTLTRNSTLDQAAKLKAEDMARLGYFAHTSPQGITPWYWFDKSGYNFIYAGENLAIDFTESLAVEDAWLRSPTHKANILSTHFTEIGIATVDGVYQGHPTTYVVQMFGSPAQVAVSKPNVIKAEVAPKPTLPAVKKVEIPKPVITPTPAPTAVALAPVVKGEASLIEKTLETITDTKEFIAVKNAYAEEKVEGASTSSTERYSKWYDRLLFLTPTYTDRIYHILIWVVLVALLLISVIEVRRQHRKNIIYGILLLVIMICLIYINRSMFVTSFLS